MPIRKQSDDVTKLSSLFKEVREQLQYHTESGFSAEEANGYAQQLDDIEKNLIPDWKARLGDTPHEVILESNPILGGYLKIKIVRDGKPVEVFAESYGHFNSEMCDGSCYQYVYQKVLCYKEGLTTGRVPL